MVPEDSRAQYQEIIDTVQPRYRDDVLARAAQIAFDGAEISDEQRMGIDLLLGQYIERSGSDQRQGKPVEPGSIGQMGVRLSSRLLRETVSIVDDAVRISVREEDKIPSLRTVRHVGTVDYDASDATLVYDLKTNNISMLEKDEMETLGHVIQKGVRAKEEYDALEQRGKLDDDIRDELDGLIASGRNARNELVSANLRFAMYMARKYRGKRIEWDDLAQIANEALIKAADTWQPDGGFEFLTVAGNQIAWSMSAAFDDHIVNVRIPRHMKQQIRNLSKVEAEHLKETGNYPTVDELIDRYDYCAADLKSITNAIKLLIDPEDISEIITDKKVSEEIDDDYPYAPRKWPIRALGTIEADTDSTFDKVASDLLDEYLEKIFETLSKREVDILKKSLGYPDDIETSNAELAAKWGVSRVRISQIYLKTLSKMRNPERSAKIRDYLD